MRGCFFGDKGDMPLAYRVQGRSPISHCIIVNLQLFVTESVKNTSEQEGDSARCFLARAGRKRNISIFFQALVMPR